MLIETQFKEMLNSVSNCRDWSFLHISRATDEKAISISIQVHLLDLAALIAANTKSCHKAISVQYGSDCTKFELLPNDIVYCYSYFQGVSRLAGAS